MDEDERNGRRRGARELRSPIQVVVRVLLALVIAAVLAGFVWALLRRPERTIEAAEAPPPPAHVRLA